MLALCSHFCPLHTGGETQELAYENGGRLWIKNNEEVHWDAGNDHYRLQVSKKISESSGVWQKWVLYMQEYTRCMHHARGSLNMTCLICKEDGADTVYFEESARTLFYRGEEHLKALRDRFMKSQLWEHHQEAHGANEDLHFERKPISYTHSPLVRQSVWRPGWYSIDRWTWWTKKGSWGKTCHEVFKQFLKISQVRQQSKKGK